MLTNSRKHNLPLPRLTLSLLIIAFIGVSFVLNLKDYLCNPIFPFHANLILAIQALLFFASLPMLQWRKNKDVEFLWVIWSFFSLWALLSALWSAFPILVLKRALIILGPLFLLFGLVTADRYPKRTFCGVMRFLVWFGSFLASYGLIVHSFGSLTIIGGRHVEILSIGPFRLIQTVFENPPIVRFTSLMGNPNTLAEVLVFSLSAAVALALLKSMSYRVFLIHFLLQFIALALTGSRAAIGGIGLYLTLVWILKPRNALTRLGRILALGAIFASISMIASQLFSHITLPGDLGRRLATGLNLRELAWLPLLKSILQHPFGGVGFGVSQEAILNPQGVTVGAESFHLGVLSEVGITGYLSVLVLWLYACKKGVTAYRDKNFDRPTRIVLITSASLLLSEFAIEIFGWSFLRFSPANYLWAYFIGCIYRIDSMKHDEQF